jgi:putative two-component system response regulator
MVGRIVAIADVFDALTSRRPYKEAWTVEDTVAHLQSQSGKQFDPELIPLFIANLEQILVLMAQFTD